MIRNLIWDVGGTLFDTYPAAVQAARQALRSCGTSAPPQTIEALFKISTSHAMRTLAERLGVSQEELTSAFRRELVVIPPASQRLFEGVHEVCALARARGGDNFIVTHRERESVFSLLDAHGLRAQFHDIITKEDPFPRKPDPTSLRALIRRNQLDPAECLMIGDRSLDIEAARGAGVHACLRWDADSPAEASGPSQVASPEVRPDFVFSSFAQLQQWLQSQE